MKKYWYTRKLELTDINEAIDDTIIAFKKFGFWMVSKIDMKEKISQKIWKDIDDYVVLWVCNPEFAYDILLQDYDIWLFLPCNVIIYKKQGDIFVSCILPSIFMNIINNKNINDISLEVEKKLIDSIDNIGLI